MAKYLSIDGARHLVNKIKQDFVSSQTPVQASYATNAGYSDTAGSANTANNATNDSAGNPIHSTYLTIENAAKTYLQQGGNAVSATTAVTSSNCTGNAENATRLATPRKINIVDATESNVGTAADFDGQSDVKIKLPPTIKISVDGNASSATQATSDSAGNVITNHYAPNYNPVFSGTPQAPTANEGTNNNQLATTAFVQAAIQKLIGTAPETLDTLYELADAVNKDGNFAATIAGQLAGKQDSSTVLTTLTNLVIDSDKIIYTKNNTYVTTALTEFARMLLDDSDATTARNTLDALGKNENAVSATQLETARQISIGDDENIGVATNFDGTENILLKLPATIKANLDGNASTANSAETADTALQLTNARLIQTNLESTTASSFNGTENISVGVTGILPISNGGTGNLNGNAASATKLETKRAISIGDGVNTGEATNFDGTENILLKLPATIKADLNGNADTSTQANQDAEGNVITEKYMPKISTAAITIPVENWLNDAETPFNRYYDFDFEGLTADDVVNVSIAPNNQGLCVDCGLCPTCEIFDGKLRFRAKAIPTAEISAECYILKGAANGKTKSYGSVNCSTSQRVIIYKIPAQVGTLTFNKNLQMPIWDDYDPSKLLMVGETSGVDADTYTVSFIPISTATWSTDTREPRSQTWEIERAIIDTVPAQGKLLTFNGELQTPALINYDAEKLTLSGDYENQSDAGIYTAYATPTSNYMFSDTSIAAKPFQWLIQKAAQEISLNKNSVELENISMTDTVIVNRLGDGIIYVTSGDQNIVTASNENVNTEINLTAVATGNTTITINVAEGRNYLSDSITLQVKSFVIKPLEECTVEEIVEAIQSGKAANAWDEGDLTAPITLNGRIGDALTLENLQIRAMLIGLNHNAELESEGKPSAHFLLGTTLDGEKFTLIDSNYNKASMSGVKYFQHNLTAGSNIGGWATSNLRQNICADIFNALPAEWQNIISPCTKYTDNTGGGVDDSNFVTATADNIFLLSEYEVFGNVHNANLAEKNYQAWYGYFENANARIRTNDSTACHWWLRSAQNSNATSFCRVSDEGGTNAYNARFSQGITPAFMIS